MRFDFLKVSIFRPSSLIHTVFLFFACLVILPSVLSQQPPRCVEIKKDWPICGGLAGKFVDMELSQNLTNFAGVLTSGPPGGNGMPDDQLLQRNLATFFDVSATVMPNGLNATFVPTFKALHGCPGYTHYHRRYLYSMWCIVLVYSSSRCNPSVQPLCRDACQKYIDGTVATLRNTTQCPPGTSGIVSLAQTLQDTNAVCDRAVFSGSSGNCISGDTIEPDLCGYFPNSRECDPRKCPDGNPLCPTSTTSGGSSMSTLKWVGIGVLSAGAVAVVGGLLYFFLARQRQKAASPAPVRPVSKRVSSILPVSQFSEAQLAANAPAYYAIREYAPKLDDELAMEEGDVILLIQEFDDGWVKAMNERTGQQGVCPMTFLEPLEEEDPRRTMYSNQTASVYSAPPSVLDPRMSAQSRAPNPGQQLYMENIQVNKLRARETTMRDDDE